MRGYGAGERNSRPWSGWERWEGEGGSQRWDGRRGSHLDSGVVHSLTASPGGAGTGSLAPGPTSAGEPPVPPRFTRQAERRGGVPGRSGPARSASIAHYSPSPLERLGGKGP